MKDYVVLDDLIPKTRELHRAIFDKGYEQGQKDTLEQRSKTGWRIAQGMIAERFWCSCGYIRMMESDMIEWKYCPVCGGTKEVSE